MNSELTSLYNRSPENFFSPYYHDSKNRHWSLIRVSIKQRPSWANDHSMKKYYMYREIAYLNERKELIGLGRSFIPFSLWGLYIFSKCLGPFKPRPLGVVLQSLNFNNTSINVISCEIITRKSTPYREALVRLKSFKRIITINGVLEILVEEDFLF